MKTLTISTQSKDQVVDITDTLQKELQSTSIETGVMHIFVTHTTCALTTVDLDPGTDLDFLEALRKILPDDISYRHPHDPRHAPDHILSSLIGPAVSVPFNSKKLILGTWQRIVLVELDGPRERQIMVTALASGGHSLT